MIALMLVLALAVSMAACGGKSAAKTPLAGTMEENALKIMEIAPVEFMGGCIPVDLTDADAVWYFAAHARNTTGAELVVDGGNTIQLYPKY